MNTRKASTTARRTGTSQDVSGHSSSATAKSGGQTAASADGSREQQGSLLDKLFLDMLKDTYWAEQHLVEELGKMQKAATTDELKEAFEDHRYITQKHVSRLEKVFKLLGKEPEGKKCEAIVGLTKEATSMKDETKDGTMTRDAALIIAAQKVEHYEIATYGSLVQVALTLGHNEAADILERTLWDEEDTDKQLTAIAETHINPMADEEYAGNGAEEMEQV